MNFTTASSNSTANSTGLLNYMDICVLCISFMFGLPSHSYIIWLITAGHRVASELFILNISVCEIASCLNSFFSLLSNNTCCSYFTTFTQFLVGHAITGRPLFQCLMCVEHYLAVVHPVTFLKYKPLRYRVICCAVAWVVTFGSCLCCMFVMPLLDLFIWFFSVQFPVFLSIQLFCLVAVLRALKQSGPGERKRAKEEDRMKRRAFIVILITTVTIISIYMPFIVSGLISILAQHYFRELFSFSSVCSTLASFVQPVLHLHRTGKLSYLCSS